MEVRLEHEIKINSLSDTERINKQLERETRKLKEQLTESNTKLDIL